MLRMDRTGLNGMNDGSYYLRIEGIRTIDPAIGLLAGHDQLGSVANSSQLMPHPSKNHYYYLTTISWSSQYIRLHPPHIDTPRVNQEWHELFRNLSNTSCSIRRELADVFWQNITLEVGNLAAFGRDLYAFLKSRPATHPVIKHLRATIRQDSYSDYVTDKDGRNNKQRKEDFVQVSETVTSDLSS